MARNHLKVYKGLSFTSQPGAPSGPSDGDVYYDGSLAQFRFYQNGSFVKLNTGASITTPGSTTISAIPTWGDATGTNLLNTGVTIDTSNQMDIKSGLITLKLGADTGATTRTDATAKTALISAAHYTNAQAPAAVVYANQTSSGNDLYVGGGISSLNAATKIYFYTGSTNTTLTGSEVAHFDSTALRFGATGDLVGTGPEKLTLVNLSTDNTQAVRGIVARATLNSNSASSAAINAIRGEAYRQATGSVSETSQLSGGVFKTTIDVGSNTYTNTGTFVAGIQIQALTLVGSPTLAISNYAALYVTADSVASGTRKTGIQINTMSGATNNAQISDNSSFTGSYALHFTSTNDSVFAGRIGIGVTTALNAGVALRITNSPMTASGGNDGYGVLSDVVYTSAVTNNAYEFFSQVQTANSSFTILAAYGYFVTTAAKGAANTITRLINYGGINQTAGTNNAFLADNTAFTGNYFINSTTANPSALSSYMGVGGAESTSAVLNVGASNPLTGSDQRGVNLGSWVITSAATSLARAVSAVINTAAASFTCADVSGFYVNIAAGSSSTITRASGFNGTGFFTNVGAGATTSRALITDNQTYTGAWVINSLSTNPSLLSGPLELKQQTTPSNPASGNNRLYFKSDDNLYMLTSGGVETSVGTGGSGNISNGGNSFTAAISIGTNDNFSTSLRTNGTDKLSITGAGAITLGASGGTTNMIVNANSMQLIPGSGTLFQIIGTGTANHLQITPDTNFGNIGIELFGATNATPNIITMQTAGVTALKVDASQNLFAFKQAQFGGSTVVAASGILAISPSAAQNPLTGTTQRAFRTAMTTTTAATVSTIGYSSGLVTAAAITTATVANFEANQATPGAGSTITNAIHYWINGGIGTSGTNNAGLADNTSFTGNWNLNFTTTNPSYVAGPFRTGTSAALFAGNQLDVLNATTTDVLTIGGSIWGQITLDAAVASQIIGSDSETNRVIVNDQTDTGSLSGGFFRNRFTIPTGKTLTQTGSVQSIQIGNVSISGGGTLAATNVYKLFIASDSVATGTRKIGIFLQGISGATNNASISDNNSFTGNWFINSTGTNPSYLGGQLRVGASSAGLLSTQEGATIYQLLTSATDLGRALEVRQRLNLDTAAAQQQVGINADAYRQTTLDVTESGAMIGVVGGVIIDVASGKTYTTSANVSAFRAIALGKPSAGTLAITHYTAFQFQADSTANTGLKSYIQLGAISGGTVGNAYFVDNSSFTGAWAINLTSTNPSLFSGVMEWKQSATPSNPASGNNRIYFKSDNSLYALTSAGVETQIGSGGGGGNISNGGNAFTADISIGTTDAFNLKFITSNAIRMQIGATGGNIRIGDSTTPATTTGVRITGTALLTTGTAQFGMIVDPTCSTAATSEYESIRSEMKVPNSSFTLALGTNYYAFQNIPSATPTVTRYASFYYAGNNGFDATNLAILTDNSSFSGKYFIHSTSTNDSVLGGGLALLKTSRTTGYAIDLNGTHPDSGSNFQYGIRSRTIAGSAATASIVGVFTTIQTAAAAFTCAFAAPYQAAGISLGAGSAVTTYAAFVSTNASGVATNSAILTDNTSYSGNYFINQSGTAPSTFAGRMGIGGVETTVGILQVGSANPLSASRQWGVIVDHVATSAATNSVQSIIGFNSAPTTAATAFTAPSRTGFWNDATVKGAGSTITRDIGYGGIQPSQGTNNAMFTDNETFSGSYFIHGLSANASLLSGVLQVSANATIQDTSASLYLGNISFAGTDQRALNLQFVGNSSATGSVRGIQINVSTSAASFTTAQALGVNVGAISAGVGSTITRAVSYFSSTQSAGGTGNATLADNLTFSGNFFINSTTTNKSRINGILEIGTTASTQSMIYITSNQLSATEQRGVHASITSTTAATNETIGYYGEVTTSPSAYTTGLRAQFFSANPTKGAGSTITRDVGFYQSGLPNDGANNAILADNQSFTGDFAINLSTLAPVRIGGNFGIGTTSSDTAHYVSVSSPNLTGANNYAYYADSAFPTSATTAIYGYVSNITTTASAYTVGLRARYWAPTTAKGAGSTITRDVYFLTGGDASQGGSNAQFADNTTFSSDWLMHFNSTREARFAGRVSAGGDGTNTSIFTAGGGTTPLANTDQRGFTTLQTGTSGGTASLVGFYSGITTAAASYTVGYRASFQGSNGTPGAGSTITRDISFLSQDSLSGSNRAIFTDNLSYTGNWAFNLSSVNPSLFGGKMAVGSTVLGVSAGMLLMVGSTSTVAQSADMSAIGVELVGTSSVTGSLRGLWVNSNFGISTAFTLPRAVGIQVDAIAKGSGTITNAMGILLNTQSNGTNNASISDNTSFTGSYFINSTSTNPSLLSGKLSLQASTSTSLVGVGGAYSTNVTEFQNSTTSETDLQSFTISANSLNNSGDAVEVIWFGTTTNAANKQFKIKVDGNTELDTGSLAFGSERWVAKLYLHKSSAGVVKGWWSFQSGSNTYNSLAYIERGVTLTSSFIIKMTGTATNTGDIVSRGAYCRWYPAN